MKNSPLLKTYPVLVLLFILLNTCNKESGGRLVCCVANPSPQPIVFEIVDKNGNNIIHSVSDNLWVTYTDKNGLAATSSLDILKLQKSATDTTPVPDYSGFAITDANPLLVNQVQGYMTTIGVNNFKLYLNGNLLGSIYIDGPSVSESNLTSPNAKFTLNGAAATLGNISGVAMAGNPAGLTVINYGVNYVNSKIYVLNTGQ